ncbi:MAG: hypothetical protein HZC04_01655 [Candidatus Lloydbacteria bacterium]|nr:hypothetical protein [Candidatus Lloydbacteria bacterium]
MLFYIENIYPYQEDTMEVIVHLYTQSKPIVMTDVRNTYQKGDLYCVMLNNGTVEKFPIQHIFRITEAPAPATT